MSPEKNFPKEITEDPGKLRIGIDLDGVVANIKPAVRKTVLQGLGIDVDEVARGKDTTEYRMHLWPEIQEIPGGSQFILDMWREPALYEVAEQIPGAIDTINEWRMLGYQIWFITARVRDSVGEATLNWLEKNGMQWARKENRVLFPKSTGEDRVDFKSRAVQELALHVFIEDYANILRRLGLSTLMVKILLNYPYNIGEDAGSQVERVGSWSKIAAVVQEASCWHYQTMSQNVDTSLRSV